MEETIKKNDLSKNLLDLQKKAGEEQKEIDRIEAKIEAKGMTQEDGDALKNSHMNVKEIHSRVKKDIDTYKPIAEKDEDIKTYVKNLENLDKKMVKHQKKYESETKLEPRDQFLKEFADAIIKRIEEMKDSKDKGQWKKGWMNIQDNWHSARSVDDHRYVGDNSDKLNFVSSLCYNTNTWGTFNALTELKGENGEKVMINKGTHAWTILKPYEYYFSKWDDQKENPDLKSRISTTQYEKLPDEEKQFYHRGIDFQSIKVFNIDQTNLKEVNPELYKKYDLSQETEFVGHDITYKYKPIDELLEKQTWLCPIHEKAQNEAYFSPSKKEIVVPQKEQFERQQEFYSTLLHEMAHSTKIECPRPSGGGSGSQEYYAREELVAELSAAFSGSTLGISTNIEQENSIHYLDSWLNVLKKDPDFLKEVLEDVKKATGIIEEHLKPYMPKLEQEVGAEQTVSVMEGNLSVAQEAVRQINEIMDESKPIGKEQRVIISETLDESQKEKVKEYTEKLGGTYTPVAEYGRASISFSEDSAINPNICAKIMMGETPQKIAEIVKEEKAKKIRKDVSVKPQVKEKSQTQQKEQKKSPVKKKGMSM